MVQPTPPLIGLTACVRSLDDVTHHVVRIQYLNVVPDAIGAIPVIVPAMEVAGDPRHLLDRLDGLLVTGSPSNIEPHRYDGDASGAGTLHDPIRDEAILPLLECAVAEDIPILALCRGLQELNVVLGGTLHQNIQDLPGMLDHRADMSVPVAERYGPAHEVDLTPGGWLARFAGEERITVNSLHAQGIDRLGEGLVVEASAPDGVIEAVRLEDPDRFAIAIQWHPEWHYRDNRFARNLFAAFGEAARARRDGASGNPQPHLAAGGG